MAQHDDEAADGHREGRKTPLDPKSKERPQAPRPSRLQKKVPKKSSPRSDGEIRTAQAAKQTAPFVPPAIAYVPPVLKPPPEEAAERPRGLKDLAADLPSRAEPGLPAGAQPGSPAGAQPGSPAGAQPGRRSPPAAAHSVLARIEERAGSLPRVLLQDVPSEPSPLVLTGAKSVPAERALDHYDVVGEIGRGGVGVILKGRDVDLGRDVAIKMLREDLADRPELAQRFVEEAQISGQLQHPGIAPLYELGVHPDGRPYFAMKLIKGRTLSGLLNDRSDVAQGRHRFLGIFENVCQAMAYAHSRGVIHRDIKPSNIMVGAFGEVQVMDWGFAKVLSRGGIADERSAQRLQSVVSIIETVRSSGQDVGSQSLAGSLMGTPPYMSPEQASGNIDMVDARSDVFSLGALLCEILTGRPPYVPESHDGGVYEVVKAASRAQLAPALKRLDACGADEDLVRICRSCLMPAQAARPADASVLAQEVSAYLAAVEERARKSQLAAVAERGRAATARAEAKAAAQAAEQERRSRRLTLALGGAVLAILLVGGGGFLLYQKQANEQEAQTARSVSTALEEAARLRGLAKAAPAGDLANWTAALTAARQAQEIASTGEGGEGLRARTESALADIEKEAEAARAHAEQVARNDALVARLEDIRSQKGDDFSPARAETQYAAAFQAFGIDVDAGDVTSIAEQVAASPIAAELVAALDEWGWVRAYGRLPDAQKRRPAEVARAADKDAWRTQLRLAIQRGDSGQLRRLALGADVASLSATSVSLLASALANVDDRETAVDFLQRARLHHARDLWINFYLGYWSTKLSPPRWEEAARAYSAAVAIRPEGAAGWNNLGIALQSRGSAADALRAYERAIELRPDYASAFNNKGTALAELGKVEEALEAYRGAVRAQGDHALAHYGMGVALQKLGRTQEAIEAYRKASAYRPDLHEAHYALVSLLGSAGRGQEVIDASRRAVEESPNASWAHRNYAYALWSQGDREGAIVEYKKAIALDPDDAVAQHDFGVAQGWMGRHTGAIQALERACDAAPDKAEYRSSLGWVLMQMGDTTGAIREFTRAITMDPKLFEAHDQLGSALLRAGDVEGATLAFVRAIRSDPTNENTIAYRNLGTVLGRRFNQAAAEALYEREIQTDATSGRVEFQKALLLALVRYRGDHEGALDAVHTAKKLAPQDASLWSLEAQLLRMIGDVDGAIESSRKAIDLDPTQARPYVDLGLALQAKGRFSEGLELVRKGHELGTAAKWTSPSAEWVAASETYVRIESELDAYMKGEKRPKDVDEATAVAYVYRCTDRWGSAAKAYQAILADASLDDATRMALRYNAACTAARAGTEIGRATDPNRPNPTERKAWRAQALTWLRADLEARRTLLGTTRNRTPLVLDLKRWTRDPDLAGIRDADRIKQLDGDEREGFETLWKDLETLITE